MFIMENEQHSIFKLISASLDIHLNKLNWEQQSTTDDMKNKYKEMSNNAHIIDEVSNKEMSNKANKLENIWCTFYSHNICGHNQWQDKGKLQNRIRREVVLQFIKFTCF